MRCWSEKPGAPPGRPSGLPDPSALLKRALQSFTDWLWKGWCRCQALCSDWARPAWALRSSLPPRRCSGVRHGDQTTLRTSLAGEGSGCASKSRLRLAPSTGWSTVWKPLVDAIIITATEENRATLGASFSPMSRSKDSILTTADRCEAVGIFLKSMRYQKGIPLRTAQRRLLDSPERSPVSCFRGAGAGGLSWGWVGWGLCHL